MELEPGVLVKFGNFANRKNRNIFEKRWKKLVTFFTKRRFWKWRWAPKCMLWGCFRTVEMWWTRIWGQKWKTRPKNPPAVLQKKMLKIRPQTFFFGSTFFKMGHFRNFGILRPQHLQNRCSFIPTNPTTPKTRSLALILVVRSALFGICVWVLIFISFHCLHPSSPMTPQMHTPSNVVHDFPLMFPTTSSCRTEAPNIVNEIRLSASVFVSQN